MIAHKKVFILVDLEFILTKFLSDKDLLETSNKVNKALDFLRDENTHQLMRKEIQYGLLPTTLKGLSLFLLQFFVIEI